MDQVAALFGGINLWPWVIGAVVLLLVWDHIPTILAAVVQGLAGLFTKTKAAVASPQGQAVEKGVDATLQSLQSLTTWAVTKGSPEVLGKITALYGDLQKHVKENAK